MKDSPPKPPEGAQPRITPQEQPSAGDAGALRIPRLMLSGRLGAGAHGSGQWPVASTHRMAPSCPRLTSRSLPVFQAWPRETTAPELQAQRQPLELAPLGPALCREGSEASGTTPQTGFKTAQAPHPEDPAAKTMPGWLTIFPFFV